MELSQPVAFGQKKLLTVGVQNMKLRFFTNF